MGSVHIGLGHQRLAILDLTMSGRQPMTSSSGNITLIFNGEIYNYLELAKQFTIGRLKSGCDTEVALHLLDRLGVEEACRHFNGMWAFIAYDRRAGKVYLSRDRFGKKPLYHTLHEGCIYAASEVSTLVRLHTGLQELETRVAARYLSQGLMNIDDLTWYKNIYSLPPATIGVIDALEPERGLRSMHKYWTLALKPQAKRKKEADHIEELRDTLTDATRIRLRSDVRVAVSLSGGVDSSIISALVRNENTGAGFISATHPGNADDESSYIGMVARHLGLHVDEIGFHRKSGDELVSLLTAANKANDFPAISFAPVLFSEVVRRGRDRGFTVFLTGQGADEAFCGHLKYPALEIARRIQRRPVEGILLAAGFLANQTFIPNFKISEAKRFWGQTNRMLLGPVAKAVSVDVPLWESRGSLSERQLIDLSKYTIPYLTHYEDRMSMRWSCEVRCPFLDHRVVELGLNLPDSLKIQYGWTKFILRQTFRGVLPRGVLFAKRKRGFVSPEAEWVRGQMKPHFYRLINDPNAPIYETGLVDRDNYRKLYDRFLAGSRRVWVRDVFAPFSLNNWLTALREVDSKQAEPVS